MRKLFNVKHRFKSTRLLEIEYSQRREVFCHITIVEVFVFVVYIDKSIEYSTSGIIHGELTQNVI